MAEFWMYFKLGLTHVLDWNAYDHILYLAALVAAYSFSSWKRVFWLVTIFTLGHSISLSLAAFDVVRVNSNWIEFLIPVSILFAALYNLFTAGKNIASQKVNLLYFVTLFFGLVHGFGFSSYFIMISESADNLLILLLEFALGIEVAQLIVVIAVLILSFIFQQFFRFSKRDWVLMISSLVIGLSIPILRENWIF
ncbi:MAG: HupE/UreJ family protein [Bacteroidota bacterium]